MQKIVKIFYELKLLKKRIHEHGKFYLTISFYFQIKHFYVDLRKALPNLKIFIVLLKSMAFFFCVLTYIHFFIPNLGLRKYLNFSFLN